LAALAHAQGGQAIQQAKDNFERAVGHRINGGNLPADHMTKLEDMVTGPQSAP
jgi:hypothetical protein